MRQLREAKEHHKMSRMGFILLTVILLFILLPILWLFLVGFSAKWVYPELWPKEWTVSHFKHAFLLDPQLVPAILNSFGIALAATVLTMVIALPTAKVLAFQSFVSYKWVHLLIYLPLILPSISLLTATQTTFITLGLTGTLTGLIIIHCYFMLPYALQLMLPLYRQIGPGYELSARSLKATRWQVCWQVSYPLLKPGIVSASCLVYIISLSQYLPTFFIGGGRIVTLPMILIPYAQTSRYQIASVYSLIFLGVSFIGTTLIRSLVLNKQVITLRNVQALKKARKQHYVS